MNLGLILSITLTFFFSTSLLADDFSDLKKMAALQQTIISNLEKKVTVLEERLTASNLKMTNFEVDLKDSATKCRNLESSFSLMNLQVNGLIDGSTKIGAITFQNGSRIIQDQGLSIFTVNERNGQASPYYFHFGAALEAWKTPYTGDARVIWSWK